MKQLWLDPYSEVHQEHRDVIFISEINKFKIAHTGSISTIEQLKHRYNKIRLNNCGLYDYVYVLDGQEKLFFETYNIMHPRI